MSPITTHSTFPIAPTPVGYRLRPGAIIGCGAGACRYCYVPIEQQAVDHAPANPSPDTAALIDWLCEVLPTSQLRIIGALALDSFQVETPPDQNAAASVLNDLTTAIADELVERDLSIAEQAARLARAAMQTANGYVPDDRDPRRLLIERQIRDAMFHSIR